MRRRKSNWRSFCHGFMLAGLPMLAFAGADYLFAPPSDTTATNAQIRQQTVSHRLSETTGAAHEQRVRADQVHSNTGPKAGALVHVANHADQKAPAEDTYSSLVAAIQRELTRVGCYAGDADGSWTGRTKVAMRAFNDSVHVSLGADQPDYILLTLLQGHNGKACSRPCGTVNAGAQCIDKTIEARRMPATAPETRQAAAGPAERPASSSAKVASPIAPIGTTASARPPVTTQSPAHETEPHQETVAATPSEPLPGRMSIGAPPSAEPDHREKVAAVREDHPREHAPPAVRSRPAHVTRPAAPVSSSKSRLSRTFIELSRNSP